MYLQFSLHTTYYNEIWKLGIIKQVRGGDIRLILDLKLPLIIYGAEKVILLNVSR
ncbi:UNVERIFIED_ORG: hypothetical protein QFZ59_001202 [Bacillus sp. B2I3]|nr:hypothetical protein [Bacillus sp. B2I3]